MVRKWLEEEIELLKKEYPTRTKEELEEIFKPYQRNYKSIQLKASRLKIPKIYNEVCEDGFKICKKCHRKLPNDRLHFQNDDTCSDGLRRVCRECSNSYAGFLNPNYKSSKTWSKEDEELLKKVYYNYTNSEIIYMFFQDCTEKMVGEKAYKLCCTGKSKYVIDRINKEKSIKFSGENNWNYGRDFSKETCEKISKGLLEYYKTHDGSNKGRKFSEETCRKLSERNLKDGRWKGNSNPRHIRPLEGKLNGNWKGGKTKVYFELRTQVKDWKLKSMKECNYKCFVTGQAFKDIHHLYTFRDIVDEAYEITKLDVRNCVSDYSEEEFTYLADTIRQLHKKYGLGICLCKEIHRLFHNEYGYTKNNKEQFNDFCNRLRHGEFNEFLNENNLTLSNTFIEGSDL